MTEIGFLLPRVQELERQLEIADARAERLEEALRAFVAIEIAHTDELRMAQLRNIQFASREALAGGGETAQTMSATKEKGISGASSQQR